MYKLDEWYGSMVIASFTDVVIHCSSNHTIGASKFPTGFGASPFNWYLLVCFSCFLYFSATSDDRSQSGHPLSCILTSNVLVWRHFCFFVFLILCCFNRTDVFSVWTSRFYRSWVFFLITLGDFLTGWFYPAYFVWWQHDNLVLCHHSSTPLLTF